MKPLEPITLEPRGLQGEIIDASGKHRRVWVIKLTDEEKGSCLMVIVEGMGSAIAMNSFCPLDLIIGGCDLLTASRVVDLLSESHDRSLQYRQLALMDQKTDSPQEGN